MVLAGFFVLAFGIYALMTLEALHFYIWYAPSAWALIVFGSLGGVLISYKPGEIAAAVREFFRSESAESRERLSDYANVFALFSRYSLNASWLGVVLGSVHVLGGWEEAQGDISKLAAGIALAFMSPAIGLVLSRLVFEPMKHRLERRAAFAGSAEPMTLTTATPWLKPLLWTAAAIAGVVLLISLAVVVGWRFRTSHPAVETPGMADTGAFRTRQPLVLETFLLGTRDKPDIEVSIMDRGEAYTLSCRIYLAYSRDYQQRGPDFYYELKSRVPMLREIVIRVLGTKPAANLQIRNLDPLEEEMMTRINEILEYGSVVDIQFDHFSLRPAATSRPAWPIHSSTGSG